MNKDQGRTRPRRRLFDRIWPNTIACRLTDLLSQQMLAQTWKAYDVLGSNLQQYGVSVEKDDEDLERQICSLLETRLQRLQTGKEPFSVKHEPYEFATKKEPPARSPQPDIGFVLWKDENIMFPLEGKVVRNFSGLGAYANEVSTNFIGCRYAPYTGEGAMLGFLVGPKPEEIFVEIESRLSCTLHSHMHFPVRPHRYSDHERQIPFGKPFISEVRCHHLLMPFS